MLKLHIDNLVTTFGTWRGDIGMYFSANEWDIFFRNYKVYITQYAKVAQRNGVEQMAIGTELISSKLRKKGIFKGVFFGGFFSIVLNCF